ncbi:MAG: S1 family peptidase [Polyangiaceae bacterium]|nr:S1 family peptidase [Polyangiaceae bacterium]
MRFALLAATLLLASSVVGCGSEDSLVRTDIVTHRFDPIIGGTFDSDPDHDGVVLLAVMAGGGMGMCTGSLISQPGEKGVVITARHCVAQLAHDYVTCNKDVTGTISASGIYFANTATPGMNTQIGKGEKVFTIEDNQSLCGTDIAVVVMDGVVNGFIPLRVRTQPITAVNEKFTSIGYGQTNQSNQNSSGRRYIREGVKVTRLGPVSYMMMEEGEFQGTTSICQGDSGGPAVSDKYAVMGIASRGGNCNGNDNVWTTVDYHLGLIDEAFAYAGSHYQDEDGNLFPPPPEPCGSHDPCTEGTLCVTNPNTKELMCMTACEGAEACNENSTCDESLGVCVENPPPDDDDDDDEQPPEETSGGSSACSVASGASTAGSTKGGIAGLLLLSLGLVSLLRRPR